MNRRRLGMCLLAITTAAVLTGCSAKTKEDTPGSTEMGRIEYEVSDYVRLGDYKKLEVNYLLPEVSGEDMQMQVQELLDENTEYHEISDRPAQEGDSVNIDYTGKIDGAEFEGGSDTDFDLILGSGEFLEDFEKNVVGASLGESVTFMVTFPADYIEDMAGKQAEFTVKVNSIDEVTVPEFNDDLVKSATEYSTTNEYEDAMQQQLMESAIQESSAMAGEEALKKAVENAKIDGYPGELYDFCYQDTLDSYQSYADMFGMELKEFLSEYMDMDEEGIKDATLSWVNDILVAEAIAKKEGLSVTEEDYEEEAAALAEQSGYETVSEFEKDYSRTSIENSIIRDKVIMYLYEHAKVVEMSEDDYYEEVSTE